MRWLISAKLRNEPDLLEALPFWDFYRLGSLGFEVPKRVARYREKRQLEELERLAEEAGRLWERVVRLSDRALVESRKREVPKEDARKLMEVVETLSVGDFERELKRLRERVGKLSGSGAGAGSGSARGGTGRAGGDARAGGGDSRVEGLLAEVERACARVRGWEEVIGRYSV